MKHALFTLLMILFVVLLVLPLMYIAFGKLKNPIDLFALNAVKAVPQTQAKFISPNYIPESGSQEQKTPESTLKTKDTIKACFSTEALQLEYAGGFSLTKKEGEKNIFTNNQTGTTMYLNGFYPKEETSKSVAKRDNSIIQIVERVNPVCTKDFTKLQDLFDQYNDTGIFLQKIYNPEDIHTEEGFDLTDRGVTTINGLRYYWYLFEDKTRLVKSPKDKIFYQAVQSTLVNERVQTSVMQGTNLTFGSPRAFLNQTQVFLSGTVYGTSSPSVAPTSTGTTAPGVLQQGTR